MSVPVYGFSPEKVKQLKAALKVAAVEFLSERPDRAFLLPTLITRLNGEVGDFVKYCQRDASEGFASPEARRVFIESALEKMASWDAQPRERAAVDPVAGDTTE